MKQRGFTITELVIIVVVIAILAAIATVNYGSWRQRTVRNAMTADLRGAAQAMEQYRNFHNVYPTLAAGDDVPNYNGGHVTVYIQGAERDKFCIEAVRGSEKMSIHSGSEAVSDGGCTD